MHAMILKTLRQPLQWCELADRVPGPGQVRVKVAACGVCRTDLHVVDGELADPKVPIIPGHEIVGRIDAVGPGVMHLRVGERVGVPWLGHTCGTCVKSLPSATPFRAQYRPLGKGDPGLSTRVH
ncbi:alcohol dehydrogenase catalytic domain-containing protein, partial [Lichenihabitans psoromatis]|uniref:alcohol dehydrogenase catalytic domain-containing protein n=1 Tax=Lichenihabitans psoromatis TaxID=2528642 RepID=UPI0013F14E2D